MRVSSTATLMLQVLPLSLCDADESIADFASGNDFFGTAALKSKFNARYALPTAHTAQGTPAPSTPHHDPSQRASVPEVPATRGKRKRRTGCDPAGAVADAGEPTTDAEADDGNAVSAQVPRPHTNHHTLTGVWYVAVCLISCSCTST